MFPGDFDLNECILSHVHHEWRKVAMVLGSALNECRSKGIEVSNEALEGSLRKLIERGRIEAQGDVSKWRFSEVRWRSSKQ